ncbi:MAG TPA: helix-turn-helix domain-containing protein [Methylocystis sp.]|jgi:excisionase family DNA binding protein
MHELPAEPRRRRRKASAPISPSPALIGSVAFSPAAVEQLADAIAARLQSRTPAAPVEGPAPALLTVKEFCARASICRTTAYELAKDGRLQTVKIGRSVRVPVTELARFEREIA